MLAFTVLVPATTANLGPGFDCLGLALNLYNRVEVHAAAETRLSVRGQGAGALAENDSNLVWQAASHLWRYVGYTPPALEIRMHNLIPLSRGLGSSSAAIVAGLMLANHLAGQPCTRQQLVDMATEIEGHPDNVAPALLGGLVVSALAGEQVLTSSFPWPRDLQIVACVPDFELSTQLARQALPAIVSHADAVHNVSRLALLLAALQAEDFSLLGHATDDRLHQPYRSALIPGADLAWEGARAAGAAATMISGAGPTLLALVAPDDNASSVGEAMQAGFAAAGIEARSLQLQPDMQGARIVEQNQRYQAAPKI